ncbi:MAG: hypothetical protein COV30_01755 [Candidatus Yanofskybacteria bacterium CG10_big_fil_rev_8_21_14_0_10_37_15]|uniref:Uncharacterized protein n=1 Tax=Candidatus Yanofskybacteria bacterium CG10_big_fil_rev_8_21_14_0_10_37_15 TaxID=1975097 RepID=A0A2H0R5W1_9BACT|nr:MAG: hypothetical protein COV30_01755 [Candidatus Yanofskybacteria bacterium CG10_big_fil_rev_8_21_14_0_10_37_15]
MSRKRKERRSFAPRSAKEIIGGKNIFFTKHSLERFTKRFEVSSKKSVEEQARFLLENAQEDNFDKVERIRRIIKNGFSEATYLHNGNVRFVLKEIDEDTFLVLTIEKKR